MALNYSISRASAAAQNTGKGIAGRARKNAENRTHGRIIGRVMMALADIVANPYILKPGTMATAIAADGKQYTICAYRRARHCAFCQRPRRRVSAFRIYNRKGQVIRADMLCAPCLSRVINARAHGRYLFNITADMRRSLHIFTHTHT